MKRKLLLFFLLLPVSSIILFAQQRKITGTITSAYNSQPYPGATVSIAGTSIGTSADGEGKYSITVPGTATTLTFSAIGMSTTVETIGNRSVINVALKRVSFSVGRDCNYSFREKRGTR